MVDGAGRGGPRNDVDARRELLCFSWIPLCTLCGVRRSGCRSVATTILDPGGTDNGTLVLPPPAPGRSDPLSRRLRRAAPLTSRPPSSYVTLVMSCWSILSAAAVVSGVPAERRGLALVRDRRPSGAPMPGYPVGRACPVAPQTPLNETGGHRPPRGCGGQSRGSKISPGGRGIQRGGQSAVCLPGDIAQSGKRP